MTCRKGPLPRLVSATRKKGRVLSLPFVLSCCYFFMSSLSERVAWRNFRTMATA